MRYAAALVFAVGGLIGAAGAADSRTSSLQSSRPALYWNGGFGEDEVMAMRSKAHEFPLRVMFSDGPRNEFTANVPVTIYDEHGNTVLALPDAGPMLYVMLPDGRYTISAQANGVTRTQRVNLSGGQGQSIVFHWNSEDALAR